MQIVEMSSDAGRYMNSTAFTTNHYVHSFHVASSAVRFVRDGSKSFYTQYLLNPSIQISDVYFVLIMFVTISAVRFILSGAHHHRTRNAPSIFKACFSKFCKKKKESKMCENLWYSCWHSFSFCFGIYVLYSEALSVEQPGWTRLLFSQRDVAWFWFPTLAEINFLKSPGWPLFPVSALLKTYYLSELAFWFSCVTFLWIETFRTDFHALLLHHVATCFLIALSYSCSFWRVGSVVLVTHDFADILLYSAKAIHYTKTPSVVVDFLFFAFVAGFFVSRLVFFPIFCLRATLQVTDWLKLISDVPISHWQVPGGVALPGFLCVLQMLHVFWFGLIVKMVIRTSRGKQASTDGDIRSDDEHEGKEVEEALNKASGSESNDQRMELSSLPGVRATTEIRHRKTVD